MHSTRFPARFRARSIPWLLLWAAFVQFSHAAEAPLAFEVSYTPQVRTGPISARVYVLLTAATTSRKEPREGPNWFHPEPFFALDARDWKPDDPLRIDANALGFPAPLNQLPSGHYSAQAVIRLNRDTHKLGDGEGNAYSPVVTALLDARTSGVIALTVDQIVPPRPFAESAGIRLVDIPSRLLSAFHHREIRLRAAVLLPEDTPDRKRPALYVIPGFGGDHHMAELFTKQDRFRFGKDLVRIVLDPDCGTGHHVFADSATNGPRGAALVSELIPYIESHYPVIAETSARLVTGHSSGGWSSLWLQITYPDAFGGVWSTSPDPVDFRDFSAIDLYAPSANMFRDSEGNRRPIARKGATPFLFVEDFSRVEDVYGPGGQLGSFEAVFSPVGRDRRLRRLWNRTDGAIDPDVARAWEAYDIRLVLERNWKMLGPKLKGKIHVYTGERDNYYLEGAVKLLKDSLSKLGSDARIEVIPEKDHSTILDSTFAQRLNREMTAALGLKAD